MSTSETSTMEWAHLLDVTRTREFVDGKKSIKAEGESRTEYERDRDRTIYSSPVRRLIGKTQVFPLDPNDHVRTRLVHSLEVSTVAEGLASQVVRDVIGKNGLNDSQRRAIPKIAETCGLLHDIGNPPFGHAGELAIASWFKEMIGKENKEAKDALHFSENSKEQKEQDFFRFEGNAQTMRIVTNTRLLGHDCGLNLTCATASAARKYISSSLPEDKVDNDHARSKPGYFYSEMDLLRKVAEKTGTVGRRHPITFLVEAADDIVYSAVDVEDGVKKGLISWDWVRAELEKRCGESQGLKAALDRTGKQVDSTGSNNERAQAFRVNAISENVRAAVKLFGVCYDDIMSGCYKQELVEDERYEGAILVRTCKELLRETVFVDDEVLRLEVRGRRVLHDLLNLFWEGTKYYLECKDHKTKDYGGKLYLLIAKSYRDHFERRIKNKGTDEFYAGLQLVTDYVSGMTDGYACRLHKDLMNGV